MLARNEQVVKLGEKKDIYMKFDAMAEPKIIHYK